MRFDEIYKQYHIRFDKRTGKWMINDQEISDADAKTINMRLTDIASNSNRINYAKKVNDYLHAAYDIAKSKAAGTFE